MLPREQQRDESEGNEKVEEPGENEATDFHG
jgi:hypothetical protein